MLQIAVCDDEKEFRNAIKEILEMYLKAEGILYQIDTFESGKEFVEIGTDIMKYKVIFLDVNMKELNGIETAKKVRNLSREAFIVFATTYAEYALAGYGVEAIRYILKNRENIKKDICECMDTIIAKMNYTQMKKKFDFNEETKNVMLYHLIYIESRLHKLEFHIMEDKERIYTMYGTLNEFEKEFSGTDFLRVHQSYFVNMKHVVRIKRYTLFLSNGKELDIPKARYRDVEKAIVEYKGEV